ncbi:MAG: helix-turn-helix domain-containing protein [Rhodobacteraceae bacterium]|nr:helix-turn-helix domain-containing protein [Paracoccaceae bacterium]PHR53569.1 MAG: hypothetical protein COA47_16790 [Robiginitomaculum sp.]
MIIRTLREDRGWSQEQLAETSGVSVRTVQRIEQGGRASLESLKCFAAVFETTIPELRKEDQMPEHSAPDLPPNVPPNTGPQTSRPIESPEPVARQKAEDLPGLTEDDKAALRYARHLREYDTWYDDEHGWDGPEHRRKARDPNLSSEENQILAQVRRERGFYIQLAGFLAIIGFLFVLNMMTSPNTLWVIWPAFGMAIATIFHALQVFGPARALGDDWERNQVEKRLRQIADRRGPR